MLLANTADGSKVEAFPHGRADCPSCGEEVIAKCGEIVVWHWAHRADADCDTWAEPESAWHKGWKAHFPRDQVEVVVGPHRADIVAGRTVIELQHSPIAPGEIREREQFYTATVGQLVWVFDASGFKDHIEVRRRANTDPRFVTFRWLWPRKTHAAVTAPLYWDLGNGYLFRVRKLHTDGKTAGWGRVGTREEFLDYYLGARPARRNPVKEP